MVLVKSFILSLFSKIENLKKKLKDSKEYISWSIVPKICLEYGIKLKEKKV